MTLASPWAPSVLYSLGMVRSEYGPRFEKALEISIKTHRGLRRALTVVFAVLSFACLAIAFHSFSSSDDRFEFTIVSTSWLILGAIFLSCLLFAIFFRRISLYRYDKVINRTIEISRYLDGPVKAHRLKKAIMSRHLPKDKAWILKTTNRYFKRCEDLKAKHLAKTKESSQSGASGFDGWLLQEIGWGLLGSLVTALTAGIGYPLAYCWMVRWEYRHTIYDGKRVYFDGTALELTGKWVCWLLLCIPTIGIFALFIPKRLMLWKLSHAHIEGEMPFLGSHFKVNPIVYVLVKAGCSALKVITLGLLNPVFLVWKTTYIYNRIIVDGRRLHFDGEPMGLLAHYVIWALLRIVTFGIYGLFVHIRMKKWVAGHVSIEDGYAQVKVI